MSLHYTSSPHGSLVPDGLHESSRSSSHSIRKLGKAACSTFNKDDCPNDRCSAVANGCTTQAQCSSYSTSQCPKDRCVTNTKGCTTKSYAGSKCFPGSATVELSNGAHKELKDLAIHDRVRTNTNTFHAVETFFHRNADVTAEFVVLYLSDGAEIALSDGHFIQTGNQFVRADQVRVGDALSRGVVTAITRQDRRGIYAPITEAGTIVVNGCVTSCYSNIDSHEAAHLAVRLAAQFTSLERLNDTTGRMNPHLAELAAAVCM